LGCLLAARHQLAEIVEGHREAEAVQRSRAPYGVVQRVARDEALGQAAGEGHLGHQLPDALVVAQEQDHFAEHVPPLYPWITPPIAAARRSGGPAAPWPRSAAAARAPPAPRARSAARSGRR